MKYLPLYGMKSIIYETVDGHLQLGWKDVRNRKLHSFNDQPSYVGLEVGYISWTRNGKRHRDSNKPAFISFDLKFKSWYVNGEFLKKEEY